MLTRKKTLNFSKIMAFCSVFVIAGCSNSPTTSLDDPTTGSDPTTIEPTTSVDPTTSVVDPTTTVDPTTSSDPTTVEPERTGTADFNIYTINDFHGSTEFVDGKYCEIGLAKMSTIFNSFAEEETSFFISAGDMWQETIRSNLNYGAYVTEAFNYIGLDCMTIGNHEFDWGIEKIQENSKLADYPFLGANIIEDATGQIPEGIESSTMITKDGIKVGVIGVIGPLQYSSISGQFVHGYTFEEEADIVIAEADKLRSEGADIVILSTHDSYVGNEFYFEKKEMIDDAKLDAVISAHSHRFQNDVYTRDDGQRVPVIQAYSNGKDYGHLNFTIDFDTGELTLNTNNVYDFNSYKNVEEDQRIVDLYNEKYNVDDLIDEYICTLDEDAASFSEAGNICATAIYNGIINHEEFSKYNIVAAATNQAREDLPAGDINYETLFKSFPFDNEIIIFKTNNTYLNYLERSSSRFLNKEYDPNSTYSGEVYIAAIDYVAYKEIEVGEGIRTGLYYRDLAKDYLQNKKTITVSDYHY